MTVQRQRRGCFSTHSRYRRFAAVSVPLLVWPHATGPVMDGAVNIRGWNAGLATARRSISSTCTPRPIREKSQLSGEACRPCCRVCSDPAGHDVTFMKANQNWEGSLGALSPSYRLPPNELHRDINRILGLGLKAKCGESLDAQRVRDLASAHDAVVVATGQARSKVFDSLRHGSFRSRSGS